MELIRMVMIVLLICFGVSLIAVEGRTDYCPRRQNFFSGISSHFDTTTYQLLDLDQYVLHTSICHNYASFRDFCVAC